VTANYNAPASTEKTRAGESADEYRLRNWLWDRALSGDIWWSRTSTSSTCATGFWARVR